MYSVISSCGSDGLMTPLRSEADNSIISLSRLEGGWVNDLTLCIFEDPVACMNLKVSVPFCESAGYNNLRKSFRDP